jgi:hypothetical protein
MRVPDDDDESRGQGLDLPGEGPSSDEGLGNIAQDDETGLAPDDEGIVNVRPEDADPLDADEAGLGNIPAGTPTGLGPTDAGLGNTRPPDAP